ncbi:penicillin-insensitive murein endopeptidase [Shewanella sp. D64]|uniref:penicillin-insensitive murein endopeptidase n=1 Tax=unclassified Shewanella TaxID=196818 RepID=UPI0022BA3B66|nr:MULTISPECIES: penicillin-insensitive murein endopeptidase [unclassified Shewanella]MEC4726118.1 penicillin-insensitive murein endopeptidase [Shewanella sp. D64]MEC4737966.1 penicillin-insensitive murein endopeptidase [Shewanella sp. E94]WBJ96165.1 penicillin-insensitive murein endopeptidase [Shewanella sp. MTB7]
MAKYLALLCFFYLLFIGSVVSANPWGRVSEPLSGESRAIGSYANGCLSGGVALANVGEGFQVMRTSRNRYYGHADLVSFIEEYSLKTKQTGLGDLLIGDMSMPRGGNFTSGHRSHQSGLDVDIWLRQVDKALSTQELEVPKMQDVVNRKAFKVNANWSDAHQSMIHLAAQDSRVARIFVNPVIKQQLCDNRGQNSDWLQKVRPWWGHSSHMHIRLKCPEGNELCEEQKQPPKGNGCDELSWWREQMTAPKKVKDTSPTPKAKPTPKKIKPKQCIPLLGSGLVDKLDL